MKKFIILLTLFSLTTLISYAGQFSATASAIQNYSDLDWGGGEPGAGDTAYITLSSAVLVFNEDIALTRIELTDDGAFAVQISANITLTGGIDLDDINTAFSGSGNTLTVGRSLGSSTGFNPAGGRTHYSGSVTQTIRAKTYGDLVFSGTGQKNITGNITVDDTLYCNGSTINVTTGSFSSIGTLEAGTSTFRFARVSGTQNITDHGSYYNIVIAGTGTKQFASVTTTVTNNLTISSSTLSLGLSDLWVGGDFTNNAIFNSANKVVTFNGSTTSSISGSSTTHFDTLVISKDDPTDIVTCNSSVEIDAGGAIRFANGTSVLNANGNLTLLSTSASNGATVKEIPSGSSITGSVNVQRYIPSTSRRWWHMSSCQEDVTVQDWQGEVIITGEFTGTDTSLIVGSDFPSLKYYEENYLPSSAIDSGWTDFPSTTNTEPFVQGRGYRLFVRDNAASASARTLATSGVLYQGTISLPVSFTDNTAPNDDGWNFVGNPYPSPIDFDASSGWTKTNIIDEAYVWDAVARAYVTSSTNSIIAPMQGFWVQANGAPTLQVTEEVKTVNSFQFKDNEQDLTSKMVVSLIDQNPENDGDALSVDVKFDDFALPVYEINADIPFLPRNEMIEGDDVIDLAIKSVDGRKLFINEVPLSASSEEYSLYTIFSQSNSFRLVFEPSNLPEGAAIFLKDNYTNELLDITNGRAYDFQTTGDFDSKSTDRFAIIVDQVLSTNNLNEINGVQLYPNPTNNVVYVTTKNGGVTQVSIYNAVGNLVLNSSIVTGDQLDVASLEPGIYTVVLKSSTGSYTQKLIKE